jgi:phage shock protein PspC (stress-responsive transcriptional regulator)
MKKTLTVNLSNTVYHIDSDAYELLHQYLNDVESRLSADEKKEVMTDIEARVSELFSEKLQKGKNVINIKDVEEVINVLGKPNQFSEEDAEEGSQESAQTPPQSGAKGKKKYYRDVDNAVLGGVAAGLAALLGWDVVLVRVLMVLVIFLGYGTLIPIYLVVWLIAPAAVTIAQKLEMQGESVTAERIKSEINNMKTYVESDKFKENASSVGSKLGEVFRTVFKVIFGFIGAVMGLVGFVMLGALLLVLSFLIFEPSLLTGFTPEFGMITPGKMVLMIIALVFIVGIPIFMLIFWAIKIVSGKPTRSGALSTVLGIVWFLSIFLFAGLAARTAFSLTKGNFENFEFYWNDIHEDDVTEARIVEPFTGIDIAGNIELEIVQDTLNSLVIKTAPSIMSNIRTEVENGVLKIYTNKFHINRDVKALVSARVLNSIRASGVSRVRTDGKINTDRLILDISGASSVKMKTVVSQDLILNVAGLSNVELEGVAYSIKSNTSGTTHLDVSELVVKNGNFSASGTSQIDANVSDSLIVNVSGATSFYNSKNPLYLKESKSGAADIQIRR